MTYSEADVSRPTASEALPCESIARNALCERLVSDKLARFSALGLPSYLVDSAGRVIRANDAAQSAPSQDLALRAGRLRCPTKADQARLERALAHAASAPASPAAYVRLSSISDANNPLALVAPLAAARGEVAGLVQVTLVDAGARARAASRSLAMLSQSFDLTAREAEVGALISKGVDITEVARRLSVATGTARNYLKNAMLKLNVHSQVELAALVAELSNLAAA